MRLVELLEHVGTDGAKEALKVLAQRGRWGRVRVEAGVSLQRSQTRGK